MAKLTVVWKQGMHFCTSTPSGQLMCDETSEVGHAYPSSPELLMASLGSCIGSVLVQFAERHGISLEGLRVELDWAIAERPHRIGRIGISVTVPRPLSADEQRVLTRVAEECLVHNTLTHPPAIKLALTGKG